MTEWFRVLDLTSGGPWFKYEASVDLADYR